MKKEIRVWLVLVALNAMWISACICDTMSKQPVEVVEAVEIESTEDIIRWRIDDPVDEPTEISIEEMEIEEVEQPTMKNLGTFFLTAYCPCKKCTDDGDGITASGTVATEGRTIAVDPNVIPYGTVLIINGHEYVAEDRGSAIKGKEIDIYFDSHEEAWEFGEQYAEVFIYDNLQNMDNP